MSISGLKSTTFGRKFVNQYENAVLCTLRNGVIFTVTCPKDGLLIRDTVKPARYTDGAKYMYVQQLKSCDACILVSGLATSRGRFNVTMYLVSYDTVVCEARINSHAKDFSDEPFIEFEISEHWNYSHTTVQHVYKFLSMFSNMPSFSIKELEKQDKRAHNGKFGYTPYKFRSDKGTLYHVVFCSDIAINDYIIGESSRVVYRAM